MSTHKHNVFAETLNTTDKLQFQR